MYEAWLRSLGLFSPEKMRLRGRPHGDLQLPYEGSRGASADLSCDSNRTQRNSMELCQGKSGWGLGTGSTPEHGGLGTGCPGEWLWT